MDTFISEFILPYINQNDMVITGLFFIALGFLLFAVMRKVRKALLLKVQVTETKWDDILLASFGKPTTIVLLLLPAYYGFSKYILTPEGLELYRETELNEVFFVIVAAWFLSALVQNVMEFYGRKFIHGTARGSKRDFTARFLGLLDLISVYVIWFVAFLVILKLYSISLTPLLAGAGIAGIAIALAAQDMLGNFFGSAMIYVDRPFKIGDRVKIGEHVGDIMDIGNRSTRIKTLDNELMTIPNSTVSSSIITNYALPDVKIKVRLTFYVSPNSDIEKVRRILLEVATQAADNFDFILDDPVPEVFLLDIEEYRLKYMVTFYSNRYDRKWESRDYINSEVLHRFRAERVELPIPQRKIYVRNKVLPGVAIGTGTYDSMGIEDENDYYGGHDGMND
ncbi:mechanosensitive ion channel family protein [Methanimicrococcus blatticola]|uniref:MscS family membrane protein n=1 Tax=Methanimicrococcus blatticola TaxID=91560 RepID=A0A484F4E9_9EURY|nr:mechanosensitive ion channel domain-containing protein [Methanimicrococcus blatticola]MBZ3935292.1 mechanosensitive ion channel [Methanimicrococcus blatticola]MCC2508610.1 mechanosensitive ion channel family protein [Methanimicrococcus blatticola]TDQ67916.1 MscS family membrane protein [Methanimicrococcus blatticola]